MRKLLKWAISSAEEGGEEGLQKFVNEAVAKTMYDPDAEILNPVEYAKGMGIGTLSGATLGGVQIGLKTVGNAICGKTDGEIATPQAARNDNEGTQQAQNVPQSGDNTQSGNGQVMQETTAEAKTGTLEWVKQLNDLGKGTGTAQQTAGNGAQTAFDIYENILAQGTNAAADPVGAAVEAFKANGTVTNKQATDILNNSKALQTLRDTVGLELPDTASGRRAAIKAAVARLAEVQSETRSESSGADGFTGASGLTYNAKQANLLASLSSTAIQNATDLYGKKDITFNDIGISDQRTRQAWINAGLAYEETSPDGTRYVAVQAEMLMDERARRRDAARQTTVDTEVKSNYDNSNKQGGVSHATEGQTGYRDDRGLSVRNNIERRAQSGRDGRKGIGILSKQGISKGASGSLVFDQSDRGRGVTGNLSSDGLFRYDGSITFDSEGNETTSENVVKLNGMRGVDVFLYVNNVS